ncbi:MAG: hypothetical protein PHE86_04195 [Candidatus Marinimicrobia bacterium]|nr:hypothetical protein [Candidatus Neomarinimicrobiota bacterium]MDD5581707.1 hypothetical protein [Candidatus Neomarinimicrobiota bacterium]
MKSTKIALKHKQTFFTLLVIGFFFAVGNLFAQDTVSVDNVSSEDIQEEEKDAFEELFQKIEESQAEEVVVEDTTDIPQQEIPEEDIFEESDIEEAVLISEPEIFERQSETDIAAKMIDIIYKRTLRQPSSLQENPANLGIKHESFVSLSFLAPMLNMDLQIANETLSIENYNDFVSKDVLTFEDCQYFAGLFEKKGLPLYSQISLPTLFALRIGPVFLNSGVFVGASGTLPGEILVIPFLGNQAPGFSFGNPITNMKTSAEVFAYTRSSLGVGHQVSQYIPTVKEIVEIRVGMAVNAYLGGFSLANAKNVSFGVDETTVTTSGTAVYSYINSDEDIAIPDPTFGVDVGVGVKFKDFIDIPYVSNKIDVQLSFLDVGATLKSTNMIKREYVWDAQVEDPVGTFSEDDLDIDSLLNVQHTTLDSNVVMTEKLASRMKFDITWQPIPYIMVRTGLTAFLNEGLGHEDSPRTYIDLDVFPVSWLVLNVGTGFNHGNGYLKLGLGFNTRVWDMGIYTYTLGSAGFTEKIRGVGIKMVNNWYF